MTTESHQPELPAQPPLTAPEQGAPASGATEQNPPAGKPGRGRLFALGALLVLSAVAVGGGAGFAVLQAEKKPKVSVATASTQPSPAASPTYGALADGNHYGSLRDLLLPVPGGDVLGPDDPGIGNDTVLDTAQFRAIFDEDIASASAGDRAKLNRYFNASFIKGDAVRTYQLSDSLVVELELRQENQKTAAAAAAWAKELADITQAYRAGPAVPGFPGVHCYLPPLQTGDKLDHLECDASVGDLYVRLSAYGVAPLDSSSAVDLLRQQLERLAIPGALT